MNAKYKLRRLAVVAAIVGIAALVAFVLPSVDTGRIKRALGMIEVYRDLEGNEYDSPYDALMALFPGDEYAFVFLTLWSADCPACRDQLAVFKEFGEKAGGLIGFLALNVGDSPQRVAEVADKMSLPFPILTGMKRAPEGVRGVPHTTLMFWNSETHKWEGLASKTGLVTEEQLIEAITIAMQE